MLNFKYERVNDAMRSWTMIFSSTNTHTMHHTHDTLRSMHPPMHHTHGPCDVWIVRVSGQQTGTTGTGTGTGTGAGPSSGSSSRRPTDLRQ